MSVKVEPQKLALRKDGRVRVWIMPIELNHYRKAYPHPNPVTRTAVQHHEQTTHYTIKNKLIEL